MDTQFLADTEVLIDATIPIPFGKETRRFKTREDLVAELTIYLKRSLLLSMLEQEILPSGRWDVFDDLFILSMVGYGWAQGPEAFKVWANDALAEHLFEEFGLELPEAVPADATSEPHERHG